MSSVATQANSGIDTDEIVNTISEKWEGIENKPQFLLYSGGAVLGLVVVNSVVGAINNLPLVSPAARARCRRRNPIPRTR